jgi:hypothetical protein
MRSICTYTGPSEAWASSISRVRRKTTGAGISGASPWSRSPSCASSRIQLKRTPLSTYSSKPWSKPKVLLMFGFAVMPRVV